MSAAIYLRSNDDMPVGETHCSQGLSIPVIVYVTEWRLGEYRAVDSTYARQFTSLPGWPWVRGMVFVKNPREGSRHACTSALATLGVHVGHLRSAQ